MEEMSRRALVTAAGAIGLGVAASQAAAEPQQDEKPQDEERGLRQREGSEFIVKFNGVKLPKEVEGRIASEIQSMVLREIARVDLRGAGLTGSGLGVRIPDKDWIGIWLERLRQVDLPVLRAQQVNR